MPKNNPESGVSPIPPAMPERLVSIESQTEFDLLTGERQERLFLKMYVAARTSGLLAAISDRTWKTLCVLATYMDEDGYCYPSQQELARAMGCSRQMVSERVNALAEFRFRDQPIFLIVNDGHARHGRWANNGYRVLPISSLGIFDRQPPETDEDRSENVRAHAQPIGGAAVSRKLDTAKSTVSSATGTVQLDTNKNQGFSNEISLSKIRRSTRSINKNVDNSISQPVLPYRTASPGSVPLAPYGRPKHPAIGVKPVRITVANRVSGTESVGDVLTRGRGRPRREADADREPIRAFVEDFAREFNDQAPLSASTTRAVNLYRESGVPLDAFLNRLYEARSIVKDRSASIRKQADGGGWPVKNKMPYFFSVAEDLLGLRDDDS